METQHQVNHHWHRKLNIVVTALAFIVVGLLFLGRNFGWIDNDLFHTFVSWQMLLIVIGVVQLIKRNLIGGLVLMAVGTYFLLPSEFGLGAYWPVLLIVIGFIILLKLLKPDAHGSWGHRRHFSENTETENGFVRSDVSFGGTKHIVLDPVFLGADLDASFGSITLDLRHTKLEAEETFIDVNCSFGGIELFIPPTWNVIFRIKNSFAAVDDKRHVSRDMDFVHELIIRGDVSFGGIEIKN